MWVKDRKSLPEADLEVAHHELSEDIAKMSIESLQFWLPKQKNYPPDSLYRLAAKPGLMTGQK